MKNTTKGWTVSFANLVCGFVFSMMTSPAAVQASSRTALVYDGPGACEEACALSAAEVAEQAGFKVKYVGPQALREGASRAEIETLFKDVAVWVQPGGTAKTAALAMTETLKQSVRDFVHQGGGYVGYCAGAFLATPLIGSLTTPGFGVFPGRTELLSNYKKFTHKNGVSMERMNWNGRVREVYFEGGPVIHVGSDNSVQAVATYETGHVGAARATSGQGRVFITGAHPEAPDWWPTSEKVHDLDGSDRDLAVEMVTWAASAR